MTVPTTDRRRSDGAEPSEESVSERPGPPKPPYRDPESPQGKFLDEISEIRPRLHRYCSRMLGSALDGEDVVQDTLAAAFFRLDTWDHSRPLGPLLFRIAHNRCIDQLRRRRFESDEQPPDRESSESPERGAISGAEAARALELLVVELPPRERSCVLLKDVLDLSLEETAEAAGCSVGAVKAALHRGRAKLEELREAGAAARVRSHEADAETIALLEEYVSRFNSRDWEGLAELLAADVRLDVVGVLEDGTREVILDRYVTNYSRLEGFWRLALGSVDGEIVLLCLRRDVPAATDEERVAWPIRVRCEDGEIVQLRDYVIQESLAGVGRVGR